MGQLLLRGMLAGLLAALLAFSFAKVYGEPQVDRAIAFEEHARSHSHSGNAEEPNSSAARSKPVSDCSPA